MVIICSMDLVSSLQLQQVTEYKDQVLEIANTYVKNTQDDVSSL